MPSYQPVERRLRVATDDNASWANVIWCTGFKHTADWIDVPIATEKGWPQEVRGVVPSAPGLYLIGLPFLYSVNCSMIVGVGPDAAYLADEIASRATVGPPATALN